MTSETRMGFSGSAFLVSAALLLSACAQSPPMDSSAEPSAPEATAMQTEPPLLPGALQVDSPKTYVVQQGDNVYAVSKRFLKEPWRWQGLWQNGQAPKLYPGNQLQLEQSDTPRLKLVKGQRPTLKLSPRIRIETAIEPIPTIPNEVVGPYLNKSIVVDPAEIESAPYILGSTDGRLRNTGSRLFARGSDYFDERYRVYRPAALIKDAEGRSLGMRMDYVGDVALVSDGDPAEIEIITAELGMRSGDRLLPVDTEMEALDFVPQAVPVDTEGQVVDSLDSGILIGRYTNVAVDLGAYDGIRPGHVLAVRSAPEQLTDVKTGKSIEIPGAPAGYIVIYKVFDLVSYGLVAEAERDIRLYDRVGEP